MFYKHNSLLKTQTSRIFFWHFEPNMQKFIHHYSERKRHAREKYQKRIQTQILIIFISLSHSCEVEPSERTKQQIFQSSNITKEFKAANI